MTKYITRLSKGANIRFGIAATIMVLAIVFIVWPNYQRLVETRANISKINEDITNEESKLEIERNEYRLLKAKYSIGAEADQKTISTILPEETEETNIVRELEREVNELAGDDKLLVLENVNFGKPTSVKDADHLVLPIEIKISGKKERLMTLLRYLEKTGGIITGGNRASRLLDVKDVTMSLKDHNAIAKGVKIDLSVNAYNLPSLEVIAANKAKRN